MKKLCLEPINNYIVIERLIPLRTGLVHLPDSTVQKSFFGIVKKIGNKVIDKYIVPDRTVLISPTCIRQKISDNEFVVKETDIIAVRNEHIIRPFGTGKHRNRVFIKRLNEEQKIGSIIIRANHDTQDQTLEGIIMQRGLVDGNLVDIPVPSGTKVKIDKWSLHLIEIDIDGEYFLSVPVNQLQYAIIDHS